MEIKNQVEINELFAQIEKDLEIDSVDLDSESLRTPKLYSKYATLHTRQVIELKKMYHNLDELKMERWKYYNGKQTDQYYEKHGYFHETILKTDIDKYLSSDRYINAAKTMVEELEAVVNLLEKTMKEISSRTFHIKNAIEWRRFQAGG